MTRDRVVKRFRSWDKGEPEREWAGLEVLRRYAPGLAPQPLQRRAEDGAPVIVMTRLAGEPLGAAPLTREQLAALGRALQVMYAAVPAQALTGLPERRWGPAELVSTLRSRIAEPIPEPGPPFAAAARAASCWLGSGEVSVLAGPLAERVLDRRSANPPPALEPRPDTRDQAGPGLVFPACPEAPWHAPAARHLRVPDHAAH